MDVAKILRKCSGNFRKILNEIYRKFEIKILNKIIGIVRKKLENFGIIICKF